jgi:hypothetical protein
LIKDLVFGIVIKTLLDHLAAEQGLEEALLAFLLLLLVHV